MEVNFYCLQKFIRIWQKYPSQNSPITYKTLKSKTTIENCLQLNQFTQNTHENSCGPKRHTNNVLHTEKILFLHFHNNYHIYHQNNTSSLLTLLMNRFVTFLWIFAPYLSLKTYHCCAKLSSWLDRRNEKERNLFGEANVKSVSSLSVKSGTKCFE